MFGSDFDTVIRVYRGACAGGAAPSNVACHDNANNCSSVQTVWLGTTARGRQLHRRRWPRCHADRALAEAARRARSPHRHRSLRRPVRSAARPATRSRTTRRMPATPRTAAARITARRTRATRSRYARARHWTVGATTCNAATAGTPWDTAVWAARPGDPAGVSGRRPRAPAPSTAASRRSRSRRTDNHLFWVIVDGAGGTPEPGRLRAGSQRSSRQLGRNHARIASGPRSVTVQQKRTLKVEKLARIYDDEIAPVWGTRFGKMLLRNLAVPERGQVLDISCGTGYPTIEILRRMSDGSRLIAIDASSAMLDVARRKIADLGPLGKKGVFFRTESPVPEAVVRRRRLRPRRVQPRARRDAEPRPRAARLRARVQEGRRGSLHAAARRHVPGVP